MSLPDKGKIDFGEMLLKEQLYNKGIDPRLIKNEKQLENILNTPAVPKSERVKPKKSGEVIEVDFDKGRWNKASGGKAKESWTDKLVRWGGGPSMVAGELGIEGLNQLYHLLNMPGLYNKGGRAGLSYSLAEDTNERIPLAGGGIRKALTKEELEEMLHMKKPKHYKESPLAIPDDWLKRLKEKFSKAEGGRAGFAGGGMGRRAFLKLMAALGLTGAAAKSGLVSLLGKGGGKQVAKELTQVPIKNIKGMPAWFKPLVNKVIKEGKEVDSYAERVITHKTKLPDSKTDVYVSQDLNKGDVWVDIGAEKHGFADGHLGQPVRLNYNAAEEIPIKGKKGSIKTKEEFNVEEAEFTGGHPENVKFEDVSYEKFGDHGSDFTEVEKFAMGKVKDTKPTKKRLRTEWEQGKAEADADAAADMADDFASGGLARMLGE
jgi:hypothetical protein